MNALTTQTAQPRSLGIAALSLASLLILSTTSASASTEVSKAGLKQTGRVLPTGTEAIIAEKPETEADTELKNFFEQKLDHLRHGRRHRGHHDDHHHRDRHHRGHHRRSYRF